MWDAKETRVSLLITQRWLLDARYGGHLAPLSVDETRVRVGGMVLPVGKRVDIETGACRGAFLLSSPTLIVESA